MKVSELDYKLVNLVLIGLLIFLIYQTRSFWLGVVSILKEILLPFLIAFIIAYVLNTLVTSLVNKKVPRNLAIFLIIGLVFLIIGLLIYLLMPVLTEEIGNMFNAIIAFFKELSAKSNFDFSMVQTELMKTFNEILTDIGSYISDGMIHIIGTSINVFSQILIIVAATIYFLIDMDKIRNKVRSFVMHKNKRLYRYLSKVNYELNRYLSGFLKIIVISFFEYLILYTLVGHPNALMLGTLASIGNLIPYFGGIFTNIIAAITAFVVSPELFVKTLIIFIVFSAIDGYVINPWVYGQSNKVHPLVVIISVFAGGILAGIMGIVVALPVAIIILTTYKFFKREFNFLSKKTLKIQKKSKKLDKKVI